jgi:hypothetical protein
VVVVPVDQGQLHHGVVAQLGRKAQSDVQRGVARPSDYDPAATLARSMRSRVLHGYCLHLRLGQPGAGLIFLPNRQASAWVLMQA